MKVTDEEKERMRLYYIKNRRRIIGASKEYYFRNKEKKNAYSREYFQKNKTHLSELKKKWMEENSEKIRLYKKKYFEVNRSACYQRTRKRQRELRIEVLNSYGHRCICCGENREPFLTIEHVRGDGAKHRREVKRRVYEDLKRRGFPKDGYTILCWNCNCAKSGGRICPHVSELVKMEVSLCKSQP